MPKGTLEDYEGDDTTQFVLQWNDWSTAENRQELYQDAWEARRGRSALQPQSGASSQSPAAARSGTGWCLLRMP